MWAPGQLFGPLCAPLCLQIKKKNKKTASSQTPEGLVRAGFFLFFFFFAVNTSSSTLAIFGCSLSAKTLWGVRLGKGRVYRNGEITLNLVWGLHNKVRRQSVSE